ncbi:Protein-lysine N-methyltransferase efm6 [Elasticomyces elasticus]|uniref:Protein-lysine N-methyltransferase EFM6 n=1 Tax=Exophiala sideris TaxID=1016849 RepID=A0ABR0JD62_9EURO|nr:Protein-lysine N-methyltransferase efm6 [Elasticomyces elasticus]KAK5032081.1 Protein-lysine N-methyltransferase efm6 [Exophiala sideris]KAK5041009.1 Protein-lysine N-methyltransferase efm6 [Exophiala sideris]KAK5061657.1 Protein-lysine N-methyltransferase efm6 [Exophiala sideris]KAK5184357.1 Protein-lysine N-methyltransferase efm6 [Eurotiomycetes sp. CCFEE 6388]
MPSSRSPSPENDVFSISTEIVPERTNKSASTTILTFDDLLPKVKPLLLHEDLQEGCGGQLWPAGMVLSKYMLTYHKTGSLLDKSVVEIGAGGGLVGLAVALGCEVNRPIYITDQIPMFALMQKNIALNNLLGRVDAEIYDWGTPPPSKVLENGGQHPDIVLAADCVYFEPAFPLLLQTLEDLIGPSTTCYFCFKKRRKADMRFIRDMTKKFAVEQISYDGLESDQREGIFLYQVQQKDKKQ